MNGVIYKGYEHPKTGERWIVEYDNNGDAVGLVDGCGYWHSCNPNLVNKIESEYNHFRNYHGLGWDKGFTPVSITSGN